MVSINRVPGTKLIESQMVDLVTITREVSGVYSRVLNTTTGKLEKPELDSTIYRGYAIIATILTDDREMTKGEMPTDVNGYKVLLPRASTSAKCLDGDPNAVNPGDRLVVDLAAHNPGLTGIFMTVGTVEDATHPLYRRLMAREELGALGNPQY